MVAAGHQSWERGDLLALTFDDAEAEAAWICDRIEQLRGVPFRDAPEAEPARAVVVGLRGAVPLGREGRRPARRGAANGAASRSSSRGSTGSSTAPEIQAVVGIFRFMVGEIDAEDLQELWETAELLPDPAHDWPTALRVLEQGRDFGAAARWGVYNIQRALPRLPRGT